MDTNLNRTLVWISTWLTNIPGLMAFPMVLRNFPKFWLCLFIGASPLAILGQGMRDSLFEAIKARIEPMVNVSLDNIAFQQPTEYNFFVLDAVLGLRDESLERNNRDNINDLKIKQVERDWGMVIRSQFSHSFHDFYLVQDGIDEQAYPTRMRFGLDLDLLKDGFFAHKNQAEQLANQKEIEWLEFDSKRNKERAFYRQNVLIYYFNREKIKLLDLRIDMLTQALDMLFSIYYMKDILYEEVLQVKSKLEQAQVMRKNFQDYNAAIEELLNIRYLPSPIDVNKLPLVDLDVHRLLNDTLFDNRNKQLTDLHTESNKLKDSWVNDVTLKLQANQNLALGSPGNFDRFFPSVGVVTSIPVESLFDKKIDRELNEAEKLYAQRFQDYEQINTFTEIVNHSYEYKYKLKDYVEHLYKDLLYQEKLRIELLNRTRFTDYYQPFQLLNYYDQLNAIRLNMLDIKQQLYLDLLKIYAKTPLKSIRQYLAPLVLNQYFVKLAGSRTIFINKEDFNHYDKNFIDNYLKFNDFQFAIMENPVIVDLTEPLPQVNLPKGSEVKFIQTVGWRPSMKYPEKAVADLISKLKKNSLSGFTLYVHEADLKGLGSIGLASLKEEIKNFLVEVDRVDPDMPVFLSVPVEFPLEQAHGLGVWAQKVILRINGTTDMDLVKSLPTRLLPFEELPICISLDVKQFENRLKMEAYISQIVKRYPIDDVVFNNFQSFVEMDTKLFSQ